MTLGKLLYNIANDIDVCFWRVIFRSRVWRNPSAKAENLSCLLERVIRQSTRVNVDRDII